MAGIFVYCILHLLHIYIFFIPLFQIRQTNPKPDSPSTSSSPSLAAFWGISRNMSTITYFCPISVCWLLFPCNQYVYMFVLIFYIISPFFVLHLIASSNIYIYIYIYIYIFFPYIICNILILLFLFTHY